MRKLLFILFIICSFIGKAQPNYVYNVYNGGSFFYLVDSTHKDSVFYPKNSCIITYFANPFVPQLTLTDVSNNSVVAVWFSNTIHILAPTMDSGITKLYNTIYSDTINNGGVIQWNDTNIIATHSYVQSQIADSLANFSGGSYWTLTGDTLHPNSNSYNVGIGTVSPQVTLDVHGGIQQTLDSNQVDIDSGLYYVSPPSLKPVLISYSYLNGYPVSFVSADSGFQHISSLQWGQNSFVINNSPFLGTGWTYQIITQPNNGGIDNGFFLQGRPSTKFQIETYTGDISDSTVGDAELSINDPLLNTDVADFTFKRISKSPTLYFALFDTVSAVRRGLDVQCGKDNLGFQFNNLDTITFPAITLTNNTAIITGDLKVVDGTQGLGKVLTSDASGNASWQPATTFAWGLSGNAGTVAGTNFIGTTDAQPLVFDVNSTLAGAIDLNNNASLGLGAGNFPTNTGGENLALGDHALFSINSGYEDVAIGSWAGGGDMGLQTTTESYNCYLGAETDLASAGYTNSVALGYGALIYASNQLSISSYISALQCSITGYDGAGNVATTDGAGNITFQPNGTGSIGLPQVLNVNSSAALGFIDLTDNADEQVGYIAAEGLYGTHLQSGAFGIVELSTVDSNTNVVFDLQILPNKLIYSDSTNGHIVDSFPTNLNGITYTQTKAKASGIDAMTVNGKPADINGNISFQTKNQEYTAVSQTSFTTTYTPIGDVEVFLAGVLQSVSGISVSGTTITTPSLTGRVNIVYQH